MSHYVLIFDILPDFLLDIPVINRSIDLVVDMRFMNVHDHT